MIVVMKEPHILAMICLESTEEVMPSLCQKVDTLSEQVLRPLIQNKESQESSGIVNIN